MESNGVKKAQEIREMSNHLLKTELSQWQWTMGLRCIYEGGPGQA